MMWNLYPSELLQHSKDSSECLLQHAHTWLFCSQPLLHTHSPHSASTSKLHGCCASPQRHLTRHAPPSQKTQCDSLHPQRMQKQHRSRTQDSNLPSLFHQGTHLVCTRQSTTTVAVPTHSLRFHKLIKPWERLLHLSATHCCILSTQRHSHVLRKPSLTKW